MSPRTGKNHNANNQNKTNRSTQNKEGKGKKMANAVKKTKTVGHPKKSHWIVTEMVQHTAENDNNAFHTENEINSNHTGIKAINANSKKNDDQSNNSPRVNSPSTNGWTTSTRRMNGTLISITKTGKNIFKYRYKYENVSPSHGYELVIKDTRNVPDDRIVVALEDEDEDEENEEDVSDTPILELLKVNILHPDSDDEDMSDFLTESDKEEYDDIANMGLDTPILEIRPSYFNEAHEYV